MADEIDQEKLLAAFVLLREVRQLRAFSRDVRSAIEPHIARWKTTAETVQVAVKLRKVSA